MLVYILYLPWQWILLVLVLVLVLFLIWFSFKFSSPKLVLSIFVCFLLIALSINVCLPSLQKEPSSLGILWGTSLSSPEETPTNESEQKTFSPLNKLVSLRIKGIREKQFIAELGKHLGYHFSNKGDFLIAISFDGNTYGTNNKELRKEEFNYKEGSLIIQVDGVTCIRAGELRITASNYRGLSRKELLIKLEENKLALLWENLDLVVQKLQDCIPP